MNHNDLNISKRQYTMINIRCTLDHGANFTVQSLSNLIGIIKKMNLDVLPIISIDTTSVLWDDYSNDFTII